MKQQEANKTVFSKQEVQSKILSMDAELKFLWKEAQQEEDDGMRERKLNQFWELFRTYRQHKKYLMALVPQRKKRERPKRTVFTPVMIMLTRFLGEIKFI